MIDFFRDLFLDKFVKFVAKIFNKIFASVNENRVNKFYAVINSKEFKDFEFEVLKQYYGVEFFTEVNNRLFPTFGVKYHNIDLTASNNIRDYDELTFNREALKVEFDEKKHQGYKNNLYYRKYHAIVGGKIKAPNRPGFLLEKINLDGDVMTSFSARVGTYAENVYSTHALEYEMYKTYLYSLKKKYDVNKDFQKIKVRLKLRNKIHSNVDVNNYYESMCSSLLSGDLHDTLLSVQMLVLMKKGDTYTIKIIQRSNNVAISPNKYQIVPAGGFEILNDSDNGYTPYEIAENSSPGCAIFREYLEEIFGMDEFEGLGVGSVNDFLMMHEKIIEINNLIKEGKALFGFLGCIVDLVILRPELSFYLVIDDENYSLNNIFKGNEEVRNHAFIPNINIDNFENESLIWDNLYAPGGCIWKLFKETKVYSKIKK